MINFFTPLSFLSYLTLHAALVEEVASDGWIGRPPDRTHDHHRGQRGQSAGPAGALRCIIIYFYSFTRLFRRENQTTLVAKWPAHLQWVSPAFWILNGFSIGACGHLHWSLYDERRRRFHVVAGWRPLWRYGHPQFSGHWWGHSPSGCCRYVPHLTCGGNKFSILRFQNSKQIFITFLWILMCIIFIIVLLHTIFQNGRFMEILHAPVLSGCYDVMPTNEQ